VRIVRGNNELVLADARQQMVNVFVGLASDVDVSILQVLGGLARARNGATGTAPVAAVELVHGIGQPLRARL